MNEFIPFVLFFSGAGAGFLVAKLLISGKSTPSVELAALKAKLDAAEQAKQELRAERDEALADATESKQNAAKFADRMARYEAEAKVQAEQNRVQFENLANAILEKNSAKFNEQSQKNMAEMLAPIRERFGEFQKKIDESFGMQAKEQFSLKEEIKRIVDTNEKMRLQTDSLTRALKGDTKAQGNWGEVILERILEDAGLQKGREYTVQGVDMGLRHVESGTSMKPDVIVNLPDGKHIIVDSKVSLTHYERYCAAEGTPEQAVHLRQFLESIRTHVKGLEARRYQDSEKLGTPDFVLMFMPIEGAYALAMQQDSALHAYAWDKRVVIVCPSTLFATLRTVASLWKIETQNRNTLKIAEAGGKLYDKIAGFVDDMQKLGNQLDTAARTYHSAMGKFSIGNGNMLRQAEQLKQLGAKASKSLPKELLEFTPLEEDA